MAQIKIEITFDPVKETLEQALAGLMANPKPAAANRPAAVENKTDKPAKADKPKSDSSESPDPEPQAEAAPQAAEEPKPEAAAVPEEKPVSKTDVRAIATALSKAGKRDVLAGIFAKFGSKNLSGIKESDYPALMKELVAANG